MFSRQTLFVVALVLTFFPGVPVLASDCHLMKGLGAAVVALDLPAPGFGDASYWERTFDLRRNNSVRIAQFVSSEEILSEIESPSLRTELSKLATRILAAPEGVLIAESKIQELSEDELIGEVIAQVKAQRGVYQVLANELRSLIASTCAK